MFSKRPMYSQLLDNEYDGDSVISKLEASEPPARPSRTNVAILSTLAVFNLIILGLNVMIWRVSDGGHTVRLKSQDFTDPAIELEVRPFDDRFGRHEGVYLGDPRPELDEAWGKLLHGYNLRVPASVPLMEPTANNSLVEIMDGSGDHYAVVAVLHELHCLKTIRQYLFPDYYPSVYEKFKPGPGEMIGDHMDHCIDILRQAAMCRADMTLIAFEWWDGEDVPQNVLNTPHVCTSWDRLSNWAEENSFEPWGTGLIAPNNVPY